MVWWKNPQLFKIEKLADCSLESISFNSKNVQFEWQIYSKKVQFEVNKNA